MAVAIDVIVVDPGVDPEKVAVVLRICPKAEVREVVPRKSALRMSEGVAGEGAAAFEQRAEGFIRPQRMDQLVEFLFEGFDELTVGITVVLVEIDLVEEVGRKEAIVVLISGKMFFTA